MGGNRVSWNVWQDYSLISDFILQSLRTFGFSTGGRRSRASRSEEAEGRRRYRQEERIFPSKDRFPAQERLGARESQGNQERTASIQ